jgi:hypothetical protein
MMKILIAAALVVGSGAASAASTNEQSASKGRAAADGSRTYCVSAELPNTRMAKKVCKTEKEWAAQGLEFGRR